MLTSEQVSKLHNVLPFWVSILLIPLAVISASWGSWWVLILPLSTW